MADEPDEGDGSFDERRGAACEDRVVPRGGDELLVAGEDGVKLDNGGGDEEEFGVGGGELADAGGGGEVNGARVESGQRYRSWRRRSGKKRCRRWFLYISMYSSDHEGSKPKRKLFLSIEEHVPG
ncbi:hypothetical protein F0562_025296 [Nyssa sinensis]|uniref:Uncharacterized protein n=1 Tax=Nyssa sinensis TaxID=561372 RepID=A0A5J5BE01_9ASTE|nr:hypothetical protein F0562_025296 [Nyssa sinensis]